MSVPRAVVWGLTCGVGVGLAAILIGAALAWSAVLASRAHPDAGAQSAVGFPIGVMFVILGILAVAAAVHAVRTHRTRWFKIQVATSGYIGLLALFGGPLAAVAGLALVTATAFAFWFLSRPAARQWQAVRRPS